MSADERRLAWAADVVSVLYFGWNYSVLSRHTAGFGSMIHSLGAEVPGSTAFVLAHHAWLYPILFGGAAVLVVAKEIWMDDKRLSVAVTFAIALVILWISDYFKTVLFYPMLGLFEKLA